MYKLNYNSLVTIITACLLFGFYFVASISDFFHITNGLFTWGFRGCAVILSLLVFILFYSKGKVVKLDKLEFSVLMLLSCFLVMYVFAILRSIVNYEPLALNGIDYILWVVFICLIPGITFINVNFIDYRKFISISSFLLVVIVILTPINYYNILLSGEPINTRIQSPSVNPISYGHSAISLALISFLAIKEDFHKVFYSILFIISIILALLSGSRGAVLSLFVVLGIYLTLNLKVKYLIRVAFIVFIGFLISVFLIQTYEVTIFDSFLNIGSKTDLSANIRYQSYEGGLRQFEDHFIFGDHIEERTTGYYPHNVFIEVLMSTGVIGFILFFIPVMYLSFKAFICLKLNKVNFIFSALFLQYLFGALFSGAIFSNYSLWYLVVGILFLSNKYNNN